MFSLCFEVKIWGIWIFFFLVLYWDYDWLDFLKLFLKILIFIF